MIHEYDSILSIIVLKNQKKNHMYDPPTKAIMQHRIIIKNPKGHLGHHGFAGYGAPTPFVGNGFRLTLFPIFCFEKMMYEKTGFSAS